MTLHAATLPAPLEDLRTADASGTVLATFERSAYLDLNGRIVTLGSAGLARGPLAIVLQETYDFQAAPLALGGLVHLRGGRLQAGTISVDLAEASVWNPTPPSADMPEWSPADATSIRLLVEGELLAGAPDESVASLLGERSGPRAVLLASLAYGLETIHGFLSDRVNAPCVSAAVAAHIAGLGPGLTPSGDDLLVGIMIAVTVWPGIGRGHHPGEVRNVLAGAALPCTTRISGAYLDAARCGWAAEPWHDLLRALTGPPDGIRTTARRLLRIGETSGADALTGFCWAWRRLPA